MFAWLIVRCRR